jgi:hypothetical protein
VHPRASESRTQLSQLREETVWKWIPQVDRRDDAEGQSSLPVGVGVGAQIRFVGGSAEDRRDAVLIGQLLRPGQSGGQLLCGSRRDNLGDQPNGIFT